MVRAMARSRPLPPPLEQLAAFYAHLRKLGEGYEKDPAKRAEQARIVQGWQDEVERLKGMI